MDACRVGYPPDANIACTCGHGMLKSRVEGITDGRRGLGARWPETMVTRGGWGEGGWMVGNVGEPRRAMMKEREICGERGCWQEGELTKRGESGALDCGGFWKTRAEQRRSVA